nr:MAG TPA: hypothetical protein [Bacteriophage sp.]
MKQEEGVLTHSLFDFCHRINKSLTLKPKTYEKKKTLILL